MFKPGDIVEFLGENGRTNLSRLPEYFEYDSIPTNLINTNGGRELGEVYSKEKAKVITMHGMYVIVRHTDAFGNILQLGYHPKHLKKVIKKENWANLKLRKILQEKRII